MQQFGPGKDAARETTWTQPTEHPAYKRPTNSDSDIPKEWVFQAKYHDIGTRGWGGARAEVESELDNELDKLVNKYRIPCHKYVLITNVPFSGVRHVGTRDKVNRVIQKWQTKVPEIEVWDATDLSRMLDADPDTRTTYLDAVLPGDVLRALLMDVNFAADRRKSAFHAYLKAALRSERDAKAEEAGDESGLPLEKVFVDLDLKLIAESRDEIVAPIVRQWKLDALQDDHTATEAHVPANIEKIPSSFAFLRANHRSMLLKGGPGVGKSTITQFLTLYYAARLVDKPLSLKLVHRLKLTGGVTAEELDAHCRMRFPLRVELRRYAQWMSDPKKTAEDTFLARYLAERIGLAASASLTMEEVFALARENPLLLILDGLDEVPNPELRSTIFKELTTFLDRCEGESSDIQLILSSRPQGYRGEFDGFSPVEWHVVDLEQSDFEDYSRRWLKERISDTDELNDARQRIDDGMQSPAVRQMATTLLQATVMLTIARRKHAIPQARHKLYQKYVEVIFERERNKQTVRKHGEQLLKLHELVGFELIRRMEATKGVRTLRGEEFKQCVQQVIQDYGPTDLGEVTIGRVVDEIVTLAKDRLCLLAGKGDDQEEVDFAIQQFREFFAAAYLARHESADPDRVYTSLVERGHVWAQVLQFYAAFQSTAKQSNWISEADGTEYDLTTYQGIVSITRRRRALLGMLPEFERPKNQYVQRAFQNLFDKATRFTWRDRPDTARYLNAFASPESFRTLERLFADFSVDDTASIYVELDLLLKTASPENRPKTSEIIARLLDNERLLAVILDVAYVNDVDVDLSRYPLDAIRYVLRYRPDFFDHQCATFLGKLSEGQFLDLMITGWTGHFLRSYSELPKAIWFRDLWSCFTSDAAADLRLGVRDGVLPPLMLDRHERVTTEILSRLGPSNAQVSNYLVALLHAIKNPLDEKCYTDAKLQEAALSHSTSEFLSVNFQLGPEPSDFCTPEEWATAKRMAFTSSRVVQDWMSAISECDQCWVTLFIHPKAWPMLCPIIPSEYLARLIDECQSTLTSLSPKSPLPIEIHVHRRKKEIDLFQLCHCVVGIVKEHGRASVRDDWRVMDVLLASRFGDPDLPAAEALLQAAINLGSELPSLWVVVIVRVCSAVRRVNLNLLLSLWTKQRSPGLCWIDNPRDQNGTLIEELLELGTNGAVELAAFLSFGGHHPPEDLTSSELTDRVNEKLCDCIDNTIGDERLIKVQFLMRQPLSPRELSTWANAEIVNSIRHDQWLMNRLYLRLKGMGNASARFNKDLIHRQLGVFVQRRMEFPDEVSLAALEGILRIDEVFATPLSDADWQRIKPIC